MRIEATVPDGRRDKFEAPQAELGLHKRARSSTRPSGVFLQAYLEAKRAWRLAVIESGSGTPIARSTYIGGEVAIDLIFRPTPRFGLSVEPIYEFTFHPSGVSHGIGITGGLLIGG